VTTVREYSARDGHLVRVFSPDGKAEFRKPRGLRFSSSGLLYCVARDEVVAFDFMTGKCLGSGTCEEIDLGITTITITNM
ncbi:MAG: hypothetical protein WA708_01800, partial [Acidobacteriaceae bacterium]